MLYNKIMKNLKLNFEILPSGAFNNNLRAVLSKKAWDFIRKDAYERYAHKCSICGAKPKRLEAHEVWSFDLFSKTQTLEDVISVCHLCHSVIHISRTQLIGEEDKAIVHFKKVNGVDFSAYTTALKQANLKNVELDKVDEWALNLDWLKRYIND